MGLGVSDFSEAGLVDAVVLVPCWRFCLHLCNTG